jgi:F-type H+-transporting ATPase subunit delta
MMQRALLRRFTPSLRRTFSTVEESAAAGMTLNFNLPHESIYVGAKVDQVIVPGVAGEYGVTADHVPLVAQLKPGVLQILHQGTAEAEKYFVAGGFSITHPNSTTVS